jgi:TonB family protein
VPTTLPPIELGPAIPAEEVVVGSDGVATGSPLGGGASGLEAGSALDERQVDQAPRLLGAPSAPLYPVALRQAGVEGTVMVRFVIDTLGRAELDALEVLASAHPRFVEPVRAALARYQFSIGEAGGRKVRTRVQMPFAFTLVR